jgi:hypothetical protein
MVSSATVLAADTGADNNLEIHVGIGIPTLNFWLSVQGFTPPDGLWHKFSVDVTNPANGCGSSAGHLPGRGRELVALLPARRHRHRLRIDRRRLPASIDPVIGQPAGVPAASAAGRVALGLLLGGSWCWHLPPP